MSTANIAKARGAVDKKWWGSQPCHFNPVKKKKKSFDSVCAGLPFFSLITDGWLEPLSMVAESSEQYIFAA